MLQEIREPLRVLHVRLATRHRLDVLGIDQHERELLFQHIPNRLPVDPRRLHGHHLTVVGNKPVTQAVQIAQRRAERAHLFVHPLGAHEQQTRHDQLFVNIEPATAVVHDLHWSLHQHDSEDVSTATRPGGRPTTKNFFCVLLRRARHLVVAPGLPSQFPLQAWSAS
jgi:hypothetical protein